MCNLLQAFSVCSVVVFWLKSFLGVFFFSFLLSTFLVEPFNLSFCSIFMCGGFYFSFVCRRDGRECSDFGEILDADEKAAVRTESFLKVTIQVNLSTEPATNR